MNELYFSIIIVLMCTIYLAMGIIESRKVKSHNDFYLAGRGLTAKSALLTLLATHIGGGTIIGTAQDAYHYGWQATLYTMGLAIGLIFLSTGFASKLRNCNVATISHLFSKYYKSLALQKISGALSIVSLTGIFLGQIVASHKFLMGIGIDNNWIFWGIWVIVITYTVMGGLKAVVMTDKLQISIIFIMFISIFGYTLVQEPAVGKYMQQMLIPKEGVRQELNYFALLMIPACYNLIEQDIAQRIFAIKDPKKTSIVCASAGVILVLFAIIPLFFGVMGRDLIDIAPGESIIVAVLNNKFNSVVFTLIAISLLIAIMSTADSLLCAISSNIALDFSWGKDNVSLKYPRLITLFLGSSMLLLEKYCDNIFAIFIQSYSILVMTIFWPVVICILMPQYMSTRSAYAAVIAGILSFIIAKFTAIPQEELVGLIASLLGYIVFFKKDLVYKKA